MRALTFDGKSAILDAKYPEPKLNPGEALLRPLLAGICSTDLEICKGYMGYTGVLGHEFVAIVEQLHTETPDKYQHLIGKRVAGNINCVCQQCDMCKSGLSTHCKNRTVLGILGRDGCFADRFTLPAINLVPVPDVIDNDHAVFAEPLAAALQAKKQLHVEGKPFITVLGDGRLGLLVGQVMARLNASVRILGKHPEKLSLCEKWGIKHRLVSDVSLRADQDVVIDCTGSAAGLQTAMAMVRPRGKIMLKTTVNDQTGVDLSPIVINEIQLIGSRCGSIADAISTLADGSVDVISLISRRVKFSQADRALDLATDPNNIKILLEFS